MAVIELSALYLACGVVAALAALVARRGSLLDATLLVGLWPLYGPVLVLGAPPAPRDPRERDLAVVRDHTAGTPLGRVVPDGDAAQRLLAALRGAEQRRAELDRTLARPWFDGDAARAHALALERSGAPPAARAAAAGRIDTIERLDRLRGRLAADLGHVDDLLAELVARTALVRFPGAAGPPTAERIAELVAELTERADALARPDGGDDRDDRDQGGDLPGDHRDRRATAGNEPAGPGVDRP